MKRWSPVFMLVIWIAMGWMTAGAREATSDDPLSQELGNVKIVFFEPFPMPFKVPAGKAPHERVFTDEFRSDNPQSDKYFGWFVPKDYTRMIFNNLRMAVEIFQLDYQIVDNISDIPEDTDILVLTAIKQYTCGKEALVSVKVRILRGERDGFQEITTKEISRSAKTEKIPMIINEPYHTIGDHANNFHPQRTLLNYAGYLCFVDIIKLIDEVK